MDERPQARTDGILTERVGDELVIYDQASRMAHSLSADAASVWEHCDGQRSPEEISIELGLEPTVVARALDELSGCGLLDDHRAAEQGYWRREAGARFAKVGVAALSAPLIYSVAIRPATAAASTCIADNMPLGPQGNCNAIFPTRFGFTQGSNCCSGNDPRTITCYIAHDGNGYCITAGGCAPYQASSSLLPCCAGGGQGFGNGTCTGGTASLPTCVN